MADRRAFYYGEVLQDSDLLLIGQSYMTAVAQLSEAVLGTSAALLNLTVVQTSPPTMAVQVNPGMIYQQADLEASPMGSLGTDSHIIVKQGVNLDAQTVTGFAAPSTTGQSQCFLIQVQYQDSDTGLTVLPYRNSAIPSQPFNGPGNNNQQQSTVRKGIVAISVKAGTPQTTGLQLPPAPDAGWIGLAVVTVANTQTTIPTASIADYGAPPRIPISIPALPAAIQNGKWTSFQDSGTPNHIVFSPIPAVTGLTNGQVFCVEILNANTGATDAVVFGQSAVPVKRTDGTDLRARDIVGGMKAFLAFDGTVFQLLFTSPYGWAPGRYYGTDVGTVNVVTVAVDASFVAYVPGTLVGVYIANNNTGASQLNVNGLGLIPIKRGSSTAITAADLVAGTIAWFTLDGNVAQLLNPQTWGGAGGGTLTANWNTIVGPLAPYWLSVISATTGTPPVSPANGDAYLIPVGATGAWSSNVGKLTQWNAGWVFATFPVSSEIAATDTNRKYKCIASNTWQEIISAPLGRHIFYSEL